MAIGAAVRRLFGPWEPALTDAYRSFFVDVPWQVARIRRWVPEARTILEVGCGEGAVCESLAREYPDAAITGIDIATKAGRLFRGDRSRVRFECTSARDFAADPAHRFDLILICDVLHHVPWDQHAALLGDLRTLLNPGGAVIVKDWERILNIGHFGCAFSDHVLTGDRVRYGSASYFRGLIEATFGAGSVRAEARVRPWRNNLMCLVRPDR